MPVAAVSSRRWLAFRYKEGMANSADIVIVGGGVIGLTTGYFLARAGRRVTILDQKEFGQEASWAGAGIIPSGNPEQAASPFDRLRAFSSSRFPEFSRELLDLTGIDNGYLRCGGLEFTGPESETVPEEWRGHGIQVQALTEEQARSLEPAVAPGLGPACLLPDLAQVRNPRHIKALIAGCQKRGVDLRSQSPAHELLHRGSQVTGVRSGRETFPGERFILASGAWTDPLLAQLGRRLNIEPVRGQIALLHPPSMLFRRVLLWGDRYMVPRQDGRVLVGSTEEHAGFDKNTTVAGQRGLLDLACKLVPALGVAPIERYWAGLRPGSPDGLPFIGPEPSFDNLLVAAGHFRAGIQLSLGTAQLLTEMILDQPPTLPAAPFRLDRDTGRG